MADSHLVETGTVDPGIVDVVLPALDEEQAIAEVLAAVPEGYRPIVVDNGSTDATAAVARGLGATVVSEPRRGFGAACYAGLVAARADVVCFMDADASLDAAQLPRVAEPVISGDADLVIGARQAQPGAWPWHLRLANRVVTGELRRRTGVQVSDIGPMRAARRTALVDLELTDRRSGWPLEMILGAARAGWRVEEVEVDYRPRLGRSKVTGTVGGVIRAVADMGRHLAADR